MINTIAMWVILLDSADWDCFKTLILQETLKTKKEFCVFSEVIRLFQ